MKIISVLYLFFFTSFFIDGAKAQGLFDFGGEATTQYNRGKLEQDSGNFKEAVRWYKKAGKLHGSAGDRPGSVAAEMPEKYDINYQMKLNPPEKLSDEDEDLKRYDYDDYRAREGKKKNYILNPKGESIK